MAEHYGLHDLQFQRMLRWGKYKYVAQLDGFEELYDLDHDPYELDNLALQAGGEVLLPQIRTRLIGAMEASRDNSSLALALIKTLCRP